MSDSPPRTPPPKPTINKDDDALSMDDLLVNLPCATSPVHVFLRPTKDSHFSKDGLTSGADSTSTSPKSSPGGSVDSALASASEYEDFSLDHVLLRVQKSIDPLFYRSIEPESVPAGSDGVKCPGCENVYQDMYDAMKHHGRNHRVAKDCWFCTERFWTEEKRNEHCKLIHQPKHHRSSEPRMSGAAVLKTCMDTIAAARLAGERGLEFSLKEFNLMDKPKSGG